MLMDSGAKGGATESPTKESNPPSVFFFLKFAARWSMGVGHGGGDHLALTGNGVTSGPDSPL